MLPWSPEPEARVTTDFFWLYIAAGPITIRPRSPHDSRTT
jgi:hypothetical protein